MNLPNLSELEFDLQREMAMELFDRCVGEGNPSLVIAYLERQILQDPLPTDLLLALIQDIQTRLHSYRSHRFELRLQILKWVQERYSVDLSTQFPAQKIEELVTSSDQTIIRLIEGVDRVQKLDESSVALSNLKSYLSNSFASLRRIQSQHELATHLFAYMNDWVKASLAIGGRRYWAVNQPNEELRQ
jgi:hypothetical protein